MKKGKSIRKTISSAILLAFVFLQVLPFLPSSIQNTPLIYTLKKASLFNPTEVDAAGISSMSATLSNPRLSFHGLANAIITAGNTSGVVKASGTGGDWNTRNLFPNDSLIITGNTAILIASTSADLVTFTLKTAVGTTAAADSNMTVAQGGRLVVRVFTAGDIPVGGSIKISVPSSLTTPTDGIPFSETTLGNSGFDSNTMTNTNTICPGNFAAGTFTAGSSGAPHTFTCNYSGGAALPAGTPLGIYIGDNTKPLINPAPLQGGVHTRGVADVYSIKAETWTTANGGGVLLADGIMRVAPVDGVLVTATVDETLQFTIAGIDSSSATYCGVVHPAAGIVTTATTVPWGFISSGYTINKNEAVQQLIVTTNAPGGYKVYAEENDQMGLDGVSCPGSAGANADNPTVGQYTFGSNTCIRDFSGGSNNALVDWTAAPGVTYGFGYALHNATGTPAGTNVWNNGGFVYGARAFTDVSNTAEDKYTSGAEVMTGSGPVSADSVYVCYRINIPGTQPAGYYFNKLKYTAVPKF